MSAAEALRAATRAGVKIHIDGNTLELTAPSQPPACVIELLSRHKAQVIGLVSDHGWSADDWQHLFQERAAIVEFDGRQSRQKAEALAFACCILKRLDITFRCPEPADCCCVRNSPTDLAFELGTSRCRHEWQQEGWMEALDFLRGNGIELSPDQRLQGFILRRLEQDFLLALDNRTWPSIEDLPEMPWRQGQ